ncbi:MAG: transglutaminase domain-containing protein [Clostridia bacterium]|nr:transglutaminase domain-containing protein [Clostridia bacterium]
MKTEKLKNNLLPLIFIIGLSASECYYVLKTMADLNTAFMLSVLSVVIITAAAVLVSMLPKKISIPIFSAAAIACLIIIIKFSEPLAAFLSAATESAIEHSYILMENPVLFAFALAAIACIVNYLLVCVLDKAIISALLSVALICVIYFAYEELDIIFSVLYLALILLIFLLWFSPGNENGEKTKKPIIPIVLILMAAAIAALTSVLVSNLRPAPLKWIDDLDWFKTEETQPTVYVLRIDAQSKLTNLSDEYTYSDTLMMTVVSPYFERLRSKTYDLYEKEGWEKSIAENADSDMPQNDTGALIEILNENNVPYSLYQMTVTLNASSQIIFAPANSSIQSQLPDTVYQNSYGDFYTENVIKDGTEYTLEVVDIDYKSDEFLNMITKKTSENAENMESYLSISSRMKNSLSPVAQALTKNAQSSYEKAKIIESYLSSHYSYTNMPPEKPAAKDFVEYFLFDTKEGFCTHYASSMVMLLRSIDIPCRYVTGYIMDLPSSYYSLPEEALEGIRIAEGEPMEFNIQKDASHAWVEVWFDGYGWLAFEPTSKYVSPLGEAEQSDYIEYDNLSDITPPQEEHKQNNILIILLISLAVTAGITILAVRIIIVMRRSDREKISVLWDKIKKSYYKKRKVKKENQTAREFFKKADSKNADLLAALEIYEFATFSKEKVADWQLIKMQRIYKSIKKYNNQFNKS